MTRQPTPRVAAGLALVGGWGLFFARAIFTTGVPYEHDILTTTLPLRQYLRARLASGEWPEWYPYELLGAPFQGGILASPFHPQMLLLLPFGPAVATKWNLLLAFLAALAGAYRLAREIGASRMASVVGAYAFAFGGYTVGLAGNLAYVVPLATAPWALWATMRLLSGSRLRSVALLGGTWALVVLGGDAQLLMELVGLALVALAFRFSWRRAGLMTAAGVLALLLASPEILPATVIGAESFRAEWKLTDVFGERWALHPLRLLELVIPNMTPGPWRSDVGRLLFTGKEDSWSSSFFAGGIALTLAALALVRRQRKAFVLAAVALGFVWLALGNYGGLLPLVWKVAPGLGKLRYPEKYAGVAWVLLAPLVALGFDELRTAPRRAAWGFAMGAAVILGLAAWSQTGGLVTWAFTVRKHLLPTTDPLWEALRAAWSHGLALTGVVLVLAALLTARGAPSVSIGALLFVELWAAHMSSLALAARDEVEAISPLAASLARTAEGAPPPRVAPLPDNAYIPPDLAPEARVTLLHAQLRADDAGIAGVSSFDHNLSTETGRTLRLFYGKPALDSATWLPRFNVCYRLLGSSDALHEGDRLLQSDADIRLVEQSCLPRAFIASTRPVSSAAEAATAMRAGLAEREVVWEAGPKRDLSNATIRWLEARPEHLRLEVNAEAPAALVVSDAFATGWSAFVDGQPTTIYPTNVAVRGVAVDAGRHVVEFVYRTPLFRLSLGVFALGVLASLACLIRRRARE